MLKIALIAAAVALIAAPALAKTVKSTASDAYAEPSAPIPYSQLPTADEKPVAKTHMKKKKAAAKTAPASSAPAAGAAQ